ncbi:MAG: alpha-glucan family phosphorylase, partial [Microbacteriaceae bacterium]
GSADVFNMAVMGLRLAQRANGVSKLHGAVSRQMFSGLWPGFDADEVPITSITNGVHAATWTDPAMRQLAEQQLGTTDTAHADWLSQSLSDAELWSVRERMREQLVHDARRRASEAWRAGHIEGIAPTWLGEILDPGILTIGFARRVPTYKRLTLMLHDRARLRSILLDPERPVQLVIAGKSHPADDEGKRLIQELVQFAAQPELRGRMVFLPDYDIAMAQTLYPGTDVWLNNPLRPLEACGTSGMKAALNGVLNLSILDGWWDEFYDGENGWAIPSADASVDSAERDAMEANALYDLIEHRIAPRFYERDDDGMPGRWVGSIRHTLASLSPELTAERMVREYVERLYLPAAASERTLGTDGYRPARELAAWKQRVRAAWPSVAVVHVESGGVDSVPQVGDQLHLRAHIALGELTPADVTVEVVYGHSNGGSDLVDAHRAVLTPMDAGEVTRAYEGTIQLDRAGAFGYTVRVVPRNVLLASPAELGLVAVAQ